MTNPEILLAEIGTTDANTREMKPLATGRAFTANHVQSAVIRKVAHGTCCEFQLFGFDDNCRQTAKHQE